MPIDKSKLGTRYSCFACGTKFYDLNRPMAICPECNENQENAPEQKKRRRATQAPVPAPAEIDVDVDVDDEELEINEDTKIDVVDLED